MEFSFSGPSGPLRIVLAIIVGLGAMGYGGYMYTAQSSAVESTETVEATIVSTSIEEIDNRKGSDEYSPHATFTYTYEGEQYTSSDMYPGDVAHEFPTKEDAQAQLDGYDSGATVSAYVPTNSPGDAFLQDETSNKPLFIAGLGAFLAFGTVISVFRS
ncbi:Uncharacterized membrane protein, DUF3592 family [Halanaeroarchaeum sp. HSR-CO]|uniref:DUF3592 domain-containing protein n=1 Tax=Halanaeroarchaeum sp. HSR-CO TaxID=2866382 RepID=UPI00217CEC3D|nr:DUF3592 domain-containing protein [Halanaeroarchaeum sp. HSR-CO]UWG47558.1 Uncharacterized membrane protein, DUF3592 family [Halanaeroarchaeum sp. HSR-CO]